LQLSLKVVLLAPVPKKSNLVMLALVAKTVF
jgi:hypothetical protein